MLVEGVSMRSITRLMGVSINTVTKLLVDAGEACEYFSHRKIRNLVCQSIQADEIWAFCYAKQRRVKKIKANPGYAGDVWLWTALDPKTKLIISWLISPDRASNHALMFAMDLASRVINRPQITTDGNAPYRETIPAAFDNGVDFAQIVKVFGTKDEAGTVVDSTFRTIHGLPNEDYISTSHMERHNLTTRMSLRRYTRDTNAHSKKIRNHHLAVAMYMTHYNFIREHSSLATTPAVAAGLESRPKTFEWILDLMDAVPWLKQNEAAIGEMAA